MTQPQKTYRLATVPTANHFGEASDYMEPYGDLMTLREAREAVEGTPNVTFINVRAE